MFFSPRRALSTSVGKTDVIQAGEWLIHKSLIHSFIHFWNPKPYLKEEDSDSDQWFVENELHTISIGQPTHQDFIKNLACGAFFLINKSCLRRILTYKEKGNKSGLRRMLFIIHFFPYYSGMYLIYSFLFFLPIHWWWKWFKRSD